MAAVAGRRWFGGRCRRCWSWDAAADAWGRRWVPGCGCWGVPGWLVRSWFVLPWVVVLPAGRSVAGAGRCCRGRRWFGGSSCLAGVDAAGCLAAWGPACWWQVACWSSRMLPGCCRWSRAVVCWLVVLAGCWGSGVLVAGWWRGFWRGSSLLVLLFVDAAEKVRSQTAYLCCCSSMLLAGWVRFGRLVLAKR